MTALLLRAGTVALLALPGALTLYLSINAGGFFPNTYAFAAIVLAQILVLRTTLAEDPGAAIRPPLVAAAVALAAFTLLTVVSQAWSDSPWRALLEGERALLYVLVLVLFGTIPRTGEHVRIMLWAITAVLIGLSIAALTTRVLPEVWPTDPNVANERLAYPLTYWNALGFLAALAALFCVHFSSSQREPRVVRALTAGAVPLLCATMFFTFSRGAILVGIIGVLLYVVLVRSRVLLAALVTTVPASAIAVVACYDADLLATEDPTTAAAVAQGEDLAVVLAICAVAAFAVRLALAWAGDPLRKLPYPKPRSRAAGRAWAAGAVGIVLVVALAAGAPGQAADVVDGFINTKEIEDTGDFRDRLINPSSSYRVDHWDVALDAFGREPLLGEGAGTYSLIWAQHREVDFRVTDAHSLYFETLAELGIVGLLLLLAVIGLILWAFASRLRGPNRRLYAALFAGGVMWALHAGIDWDWEMPATTLWFFALGGIALAERARQRPAPDGSGNTTRVLMAAGWLAVAIAPVLLFFAQTDLDRSTRAFDEGDCPAATRAALDSIETMSARPEPYQIIGWCDTEQGFPRLGIRAMQKAIDKDPDNWEGWYGLALARGQAGFDPRPDARRALALNPREVLLRDRVRQLERARSPRTWERVSAEAQQEILGSGRLSITD